MGNKKVIIISGSTATGKTGLSIELAKRFKDHRFAIVNFDSLLFYKELNIGTAKPSQEEIDEIEHHLVNVQSAKKEINASDFVTLAEITINELHIQGKVPILVGGSTFYLRSLIKGMYESTASNDKLKEEIQDLMEKKGIEYFREYLKENDEQSFIDLHPNDHYRIQRAYEHHRLTGQKISDQKKMADKNDPYDFSKNSKPDWDILHLSLLVDKEDHWEIIENRTRKMIDEGLIEEVRDLLENGFTGQEKPMQSIGYKETLAYINKEISTKEELIEKIYFATRKLAKSQKTFLQKVTPKEVFDPRSDTDQILELVSKYLSN